MGRVIFMCGPAGSGKSTVAREYEQQGMVRLSFDQEASPAGERTAFSVGWKLSGRSSRVSGATNV
jgi:shikimate kinase